MRAVSPWDRQGERIQKIKFVSHSRKRWDSFTLYLPTAPATRRKEQRERPDQVKGEDSQGEGRRRQRGRNTNMKNQHKKVVQKIGQNLLDILKL
jgi:hypothetical protein